MSRRLVVLVEGTPDPQAAVAWAVTLAGRNDLVELVAPWRRGQTEVDPVSGRIVDAPTAAHLRLLRELDRARAVRPEGRLTLSPRPGSPLELLPTIEADLIVLAGNDRSRWRPNAPARSAALLRSTERPVVVVRATPGGAEALLRGATGLRQDDGADLLDRLTRP